MLLLGLLHSFIDNRLRNIFGNTLKTGISVFSYNFHNFNEYFIAHSLYTMVFLLD